MFYSHQKLIAFVGLAGSGKTVAAQYVKDRGIPVVYFGDIIRRAMEQEGIETTWENQQEFREAIRKREGNDFVALQAIKQIRDLFQAGQHKIVLDGLYTWTEYKTLKHEFPGELIVVAVVSPKHLRIQRMGKRPIRPLTPEQVNQRDWAEIENLEKGGPIAIADHFISNDGSLDALHEQLDGVLQETGFFA